MSIPKFTWAVCIAGALSLGGCAFDATGTGGPDEEDQVGVASWDLTYDEEAPEGDDDGAGEVGEEVDDGENGALSPSDLGNPEEKVEGPHPDPWHELSSELVGGPGSKD